MIRSANENDAQVSGVPSTARSRSSVTLKARTRNENADGAGRCLRPPPQVLPHFSPAPVRERS